MEKLTKEQICTHYADDPSRYMGAVNPPIFQSSLFTECEGNEPGKEGRWVYTRVSNPTTDIVEQKIAALEHGDRCLAFASGMGAISAAILHYVQKDSHIVAVASVYGPTRNFMERYLQRFGVTVTYVTGSDVQEIEDAIRPNTSLIYLESPSSMLFLIQDLRAIAALAKRHGVHTVIDNSYCTPIFQNPLDFGIDLVVHTASKYLGGHSDIVAGVVVGNQKEIESIRHEERELLGAVQSPFDSYLMLRGVRTLATRMKMHFTNALEMVEWFAKMDIVKEVIYPYHPSHPQFELAKTQMTGACGLLSVVFDLPGEKLVQLGKELQCFHVGPSWGGYESMYNCPGAFLEADNATCKKGMVRLHIGQEDTDTLKDDWENALKKVL